MKLIAVTQRAYVNPDHGERRDALDQNWAQFLEKVGCTPLLLPNHLEQANALLSQCNVAGYLLTGGGDLSAYGGGTPERDILERYLMDAQAKDGKPLLGVCRGMQAIQCAFGETLSVVENHVARDHNVIIGSTEIRTNSFHNLGCRQSGEEFEVWARADDGIVEGIRHRARNILGIMWHPERNDQFSTTDIDLFKDHFL